MSVNGFIIIPRAAYDALERGIITGDMFQCLSLLYRWREYESNLVREVSAERIREALSLLPYYSDKLPSIITVRRWMRGLREAGWFTWDYVAGAERPYNVYLKNMGVCANFEGHVQERGEERGKERAEGEQEERAQTDANPSEIRHWKSTSAFQ